MFRKLRFPIYTFFPIETVDEASVHTDAVHANKDGGWWDVHTHRLDGDLQHAVWSCGWKDTVELSPVSGRKPEDSFPVDSCLMEEIPGISNAHPIYISVGIHPWYLTEANFSEQWRWLTESVRSERVVAIGEAGLDKAVEVPFELQLSAFRRVIGVADEYGFPLIIHAVKASNEILELKKKLRPRNPWIIHGFRGKKELAQAYLRNGIYLSYGARYQEEALRSTPLDYLFLETDESATDIRELYVRAAKILEVPEINLREKVRQNINKLFFRH